MSRALPARRATADHAPAAPRACRAASLSAAGEASLPAARRAGASWAPALTGVRGLAAAWVLLFHAWLLSGRPEPFASLVPVLGTLVGTGWFGVDVFFVLSGFILTWQKEPAAWGVITGRSYADFIVRRVLRVYPAYYACLSVLLALAWAGVYGSVPGRLDLALHLGMVHNADAPSVSSINGVFWSLPFEWQFYLVFPLLLALAARFGVGVFLALAVVVSAGWKLWALALAPHPSLALPSGITVDLLAQLPFRIDEFALGMAAAMVVRQRSLPAGSVLACRLIGATALALAVVYFGATGTPWWTPDLVPVARTAWVGAATACLLIGLASGAGASGRVLSTPVAVWLGEISYSVYLWHLPVLELLIRSFPALVGDAPAVAAFGRLLLVAIPVVLAVSAASYYAVERPFLRARTATGSRAPDRGAR